MRDCLPAMVERDVTVITNAGGINPLGLGRAIARWRASWASTSAWAWSTATTSSTTSTASPPPATPWTTWRRASPWPRCATASPRPTSTWAPSPWSRRLAAGCRVIVTGRVTDTGITLAPMIHEFGWAEDDWDRLAAGVVAGHIIECGTQATGGNFTDWREVPNLHKMGYPIIEMGEDGVFEVTKHTGTGGLVSVKTVKEQLVYEMGDPTAYISPDGVARFDTIELAQAGRNRVRISGVKGEPRPRCSRCPWPTTTAGRPAGTVLICGPEATRRPRPPRASSGSALTTASRPRTPRWWAAAPSGPNTWAAPTQPRCCCASACATTTARS